MGKKEETTKWVDLTQGYTWYQHDALLWLSSPIIRAKMTSAEDGGYIRLLCVQWQYGGIPKDVKFLVQLAGRDVRFWNRWLDKFSHVNDEQLLSKCVVTAKQLHCNCGVNTKHLLCNHPADARYLVSPKLYKLAVKSGKTAILTAVDTDADSNSNADSDSYSDISAPAGAAKKKTVKHPRCSGQVLPDAEFQILDPADQQLYADPACEKCMGSGCVGLTFDSDGYGVEGRCDCTRR